MPELDITTWVFLWTGAFLGGLATGGAGFAFALVSSAVWLHVLEPKAVTSLVVTAGSLLQLAVFWPIRRLVEPARIGPFLLGGIVGVPIGVMLLSAADPRSLRWSLGLFLSIYGTYALLAPKLPVINIGRPADVVVGIAGGIMGGLGGYGGVLPTIWTQLRGWPKDVARGVYQPFGLAAHLGALALLGWAGPDPRTLMLTLACLVPLAAGGGLGLIVYRRLDERRFKQLLSGLLVASGLALVF